MTDQLNNEIQSFAKLLGQKGGQKTLENKGKDHFRRIARLAVIARRKNKKKLSTDRP